MHLVPKHELENKLKHVRLNLATLGSTSIAAPGNGYAYIPVYAWAVASGYASINYTNGTGGSNLFEMKLAAGAYAELNFWEEPSLVSGNKCPVIETHSGIGVHDIHVWLMKVRAGAGADALGQ